MNPIELEELIENIVLDLEPQCCDSSVMNDSSPIINEYRFPLHKRFAIFYLVSKHPEVRYNDSLKLHNS